MHRKQIKSISKLFVLKFPAAYCWEFYVSYVMLVFSPFKIMIVFGKLKKPCKYKCMAQLKHDIVGQCNHNRFF